MIELFTSAFLTLAVIIDPPGCAPIFAGLTKGTDNAHRRAMAIRSAVVAWCILLFFAAFKLGGIYVATGVAIVATIVTSRINGKDVEPAATAEPTATVEPADAEATEEPAADATEAPAEEATDAPAEEATEAPAEEATEAPAEEATAEPETTPAA